jgi:Adenylate and Guanylate cyclase catalytic domain
VLPEGIDLYLVIHDRCGHTHTWEVNGPTVTYLGVGDRSRLDHAHQKRSVEFATYARHQGGDHPRNFIEGMDRFSTKTYAETFGAAYDELFHDEIKGAHCAYVLELHPTLWLEIAFESERPRLYAYAVVAIFGVILLFLLAFDFMVVRRQRKLMDTARKTHAVVASLLPENVQKRILDDVELHNKNNNTKSAVNKGANGSKAGVAKPLEVGAKSGDGNKEFAYGSKPIADHFDSATILFSDLAGFTQWSSNREPTQVFQLLEKIYCAFDELAKARGVFKVRACIEPTHFSVR